MMKKSVQKLKRPFILTVLLNLLLLIAVLYLMNYVQKLLYSDTQINLTEVVTQNKDVITNKLKLEVNHLDFVAGQVADYMIRNSKQDTVSMQEAIAYYSENTWDNDIFVAGKDGKAYFGDGTMLDIAGRRYYQYAMEGEPNISERIISRTSGEEIFVISVPLYAEGVLMGTVQKSYSPQEMYELCSVSLFSSQGFMSIINSDGYIQITSQNSAYSHESENYYRLLNSQGSWEASKQLEEDVRNNHAGFMETTINGQKFFSAYTSIEDVHDWYLICSVSTSAVSRNTNTVIQMFYFILCIVVVVFAASLLYFFFYKNRQQAAFARVAFVDTITHGDTFNKFLFDLRETLQEYPEKPYTLLCFDIDNFKYVNNYYGFDVGDHILQSIYADMSGKLRSGERLARISGDQFVALLEDAAPARLQQLLPQVRTEEGVTIYISAGSYTITDPSESINLMVDKASTAAQSEKGVLKKTVVPYSEQFDKAIMHNEQLKREVEDALTNGEIIPFYQPKVDVNTGTLVGAEALARWKRKTGPMVSPGEFIPLCEQTGQIIDVDMAIFEQVLVFLERNLRKGVACVPISVNFSRLHLMNDRFIHRIVERLEAHEVPSKYIEIELTESVIFDNHKAIIEFANHLHEHGLLIDMDDFGSGYSSLNLLKDIPIDVLKIDRGFLDASGNVDRQRVILSTIADMAKRLNTSVVVEGVETSENVTMMKEFGCSIAQGYFFARPMDEEAFGKIFREGTV